MNLTILKNSLCKGRVTQRLPERGVNPGEGIEKLGAELRDAIHARFGRSLHIRQVDTGSCGACESEIIACSNPLYDVQRFGVDFVASPRHADMLLVTGPVSRNMELALKKTYAAMPEPKYVITLGDCALNGGPFQDAYYTCRGVGAIVPVTFHIPGCPPNPTQIIQFLRSFISGTPENPGDNSV